MKDKKYSKKQAFTSIIIATLLVTMVFIPSFSSKQINSNIDIPQEDQENSKILQILSGLKNEFFKSLIPNPDINGLKDTILKIIKIGGGYSGIIDFHQWANVNMDWINGILNSQNSLY